MIYQLGVKMTDNLIKKNDEEGYIIAWKHKLNHIDQGKFKYSSLAVGRRNTPSEGFIYLLYEFGDFENNYAGAKIAKFNMSWLLHGKDIDQYLK